MENRNVTDSEKLLLEFAKRTDNINKRLIYLFAGTILIFCLLMGYKENLAYTDYEFPEITNTNTATNEIGDVE